MSATWTVPSTAVSGVYMARLENNEGGATAIWFVVRNDASTSPIYYQTSDQTWQAYNAYGGNSLYVCSVNCPDDPKHSYLGASKVSYNRPLVTSGEQRPNTFMYDEYPMVRFLERNGYDVSYTTGVDTNNATRGALIKNHKLFISSGHDEYWSGPQRANVEAARNAATPVNLAFFSGNEMYWRTRFENSTVSSTTTTTDRTLTTYKDTHYDAKVDPVQWTGTWRDPRFTTAADGITPENALIGQLFIVNSGSSAIEIPYAFSKLRMWRNTPVASLTSRPEVHPLERDARLRVGRRRRQRLPAPRLVPAVGHHPQRSRDPARLRQRVRSRGHRAPQHDALQGAERSTRLRFRHRAVVVGTGYVQPDQSTPRTRRWTRCSRRR